jgi:xanthine dehydrogenase accessory factor
VRTVKSIGDAVLKGDIILYVDDTPVKAQIDGVLRGLIRPITVPEGEKVGDVDPRGNRDYCFTISEKARAIGGGVLEAIMHKLS